MKVIKISSINQQSTSCKREEICGFKFNSHLQAFNLIKLKIMGGDTFQELSSLSDGWMTVCKLNFKPNISLREILWLITCTSL